MDGSSGTIVVAEPDWRQLLKKKNEIALATAHWARITSEMEERQILAPSNAHAIQRLVLAYINYDRCSAEVAKAGAVLQPKADNTRAIARLSPHFNAQKAASAEAERLEAQLGLSTVRRARAGKVTRQRRRTTRADDFLGTSKG
jgi:P27 family predicted phage terminase small subunit